MELGGRWTHEKESIDNVQERLEAIFRSCKFLLLHTLSKFELLFTVKF